MQRFRIIFWTIDSCKMANWNISAYIHFYLQTCFQEPLFFRIQVFLSTLVLFVSSFFSCRAPVVMGRFIELYKVVRSCDTASITLWMTTNPIDWCFECRFLSIRLSIEDQIFPSSIVSHYWVCNIIQPNTRADVFF